MHDGKIKFYLLFSCWIKCKRSSNQASNTQNSKYFYIEMNADDTQKWWSYTDAPQSGKALRYSSIYDSTCAFYPRAYMYIVQLLLYVGRAGCSLLLALHFTRYDSFHFGPDSHIRYHCHNYFLAGVAVISFIFAHIFFHKIWIHMHGGHLSYRIHWHRRFHRRRRRRPFHRCRHPT